MSFPIYVVDAFTIVGKSFSGNPAGVCLLEYDDDITDEEKQQIAMEMNLSETAFVSFGWTKGNRLSAGTNSRTLRWFTPKNEVPLCGHATLASAKIVQNVQFKDGKDMGGEKSINFESKYRGKLGAILREDGSITLDFPSNPTHSLNQDPKESPWLDSMMTALIGSDFNKLVKDIQYSSGTKILLVRLNDESMAAGLAKINPNYKEMMSIDTSGVVHDIIVTVKGIDAGKQDFYSRFFAPWDGIDEGGERFIKLEITLRFPGCDLSQPEIGQGYDWVRIVRLENTHNLYADPVTGIAHTVLAPYWTKVLGKKGTLKARQHSLRGGDLQCIAIGDRVHLSGEARIGLRGEIFL